MFFISLLSILISSYFFLCILFNKNKIQNIPVFIIFILLVFSQIVISFEVLSLFSSIAKNNFLILNLLFLITSVFVFVKKKNPFLIICYNNELKKIKNALVQDKILLFLSVCFLLFLVFQLISVLFFSVNFGDALVYYFPRCTAWIQNGTVSHYITPDSRELIYPINSELLYTWLFLFRKNEIGSAIFSYTSFICSCYLIYKFIGELGFSYRRRLWSIFVFASFALVGVEMRVPCSDLLTSALILSTIYLFFIACKTKEQIYIFFSSLSYALAIGTKTTALAAIPSVCLICFFILIFYDRNNLKKTIINFVFMFIINFIIFGSYSYILNMISFGNPLGCSEQLLLNKFRGGFLGWLTSVIKYIFVIFDTSGIKGIDGFNGFITYIQSLVLSLFGCNDKSFTSSYFPRSFSFNSSVSMVESALGIMGLLVFLPSFCKTINLGIRKKHNKKYVILFFLGLSLIINIFIFSGLMVFTKFNMRYILTFFVISSPIILYSYIKNNKSLYKILLCLFMFIYMYWIPHQLPASYIVQVIKDKIYNRNISKEFNYINCEENKIFDYLKNKKINYIALAVNQDRNFNYHLEKLRFEGIIIDKILIENIEQYDLSKYDYIVTSKDVVYSTYIVNFQDMLKYPDLFVSECSYYDYKGSIISSLNEEPAMVKCIIPFNYFIYRNFVESEDLKLEKYKILKKNSY